MTRAYNRLPPDDVLIAAYERYDRSLKRTAEANGWVPASLSYRLRRIGIISPRPASVRVRLPRLEQRADELDAAFDRLQAEYIALADRYAELETRVHSLEARPLAIAVHEDHRRIADGGVGGRHSRRAALRGA